MTRPGAHCSTTSAGQASPATNSAADPKLSGASAVSAEGVWLNMLTCSSTSKVWKSSGVLATDSGTTTSRAPNNSALQISSTEASKANECHCAHTCPGSCEYNDSNNWVTLWWVTATPFGTPVVPEV